MNSKKNKIRFANKEILIIGFVVLSNILKTSLGPYGKLKVIYFNNSKLYITKDSKIILNKMKFSKILHFVTKSILNSYHSTIRDGTISIIIISSYMIKNITTSSDEKIQLKKHIIATKLNCKKVLNLVKIISFYNYKDFNSKYLFWWLFCIAKTAFGTKIASGDSFTLAKISLIIAIRLKGTCSLNSIKLISKPGGTINETFIDNCVLIKANQGTAKDIYLENIRISTHMTFYNNSEDTAVIKNIRLSNYNLEKFIQNEKEIMKQKCKNILNNGINFLFANFLIQDILSEFFAKTFLTIVDNCNLLDTIFMSTYSAVYNNLFSANLFNQISGSVKLIECVVIDNYKYIIFEKSSSSLNCSLIVRGPDLTYIDEINALLFRVITNLVYVIADCRFLLSGCSVEFKILNYLLNNIKYFQSDDKNKLLVMPLSIEIFLKNLFENSHINFNLACVKLLSINMNYDNKDAYDLFYKIFLHSDKIGLCEPSKLKEQIFISSVGLTEIISRINVIIFNK